MPGKPLAIRFLEQRKVPHQVFEFDNSIRSAAEVARATGMPPHTVFKTLVVERDPPQGKPYLLMMPAESEVDLKALASTLGVKKVRMASHKDAERHTGLQVGGISALALLDKGFEVYIDSRALELEEILVSAGKRGVDVKVGVRDLMAASGARPIESVGTAVAGFVGLAEGSPAPPRHRQR